ncbi:MAG: hypothetical protein WAK23_17265, partial [Terriglobales bacterium]
QRPRLAASSGSQTKAPGSAGGYLLWKILHEGVRFVEQGSEVSPRQKKKRAQMLARALRKLG